MVPRPWFAQKESKILSQSSRLREGVAERKVNWHYQAHFLVDHLAISVACEDSLFNSGLTTATRTAATMRPAMSSRSYAPSSKSSNPSRIHRPEPSSNFKTTEIVPSGCSRLLLNRPAVGSTAYAVAKDFGARVDHPCLATHFFPHARASRL